MNIDLVSDVMTLVPFVSIIACGFAVSLFILFCLWIGRKNEKHYVEVAVFITIATVIASALAVAACIAGV